MRPRRCLRRLDAISIGIIRFHRSVEEFIFVRTTMQQWLLALVLVLSLLLAIQIFHYRI